MKEDGKYPPNHLLRRERERRCWTQQELADRVGTTTVNISRWERGVNRPFPILRRKLCDVFEKDTEQLGLVYDETVEHYATKILQNTNSSSIVPPVENSASLWYMPQRRNRFFTGREEVLFRIQAALTQEQTVPQSQPQAITGLGGIGKTQIAIEYAYRYRHFYNIVVWMRADTPELLTSDFLLLANLLHLPERNEQDQTIMVEAVKHWFGRNQRWLLILDNANDLEIVSNFIPVEGNGHVLLTTRSQATGTIAQRISIETMSKEEGILFLLRRSEYIKTNSTVEQVSETIRSQAQTIVEELGGLPLALDQAGAFIEETRCTMADYLKFYKTRRKKLLRKRGQDAAGHPEPVATTWELSFEKVKLANPAAAELLGLCAFLHPDTIPEAMLEAGASELGLVLQPVVEDSVEFNEAIRELLKHSLVSRNPEEKTLHTHRLVQTVLKDAMSVEMQQQGVRRAIRMIKRAFPNPPDFTNWPSFQCYLPHVQVCVEQLQQLKIRFIEAAQLFHQSGLFLWRSGRYGEVPLHYEQAAQFIQHALKIYEWACGPGHVYVTNTQHELGQLYVELGKYTEEKQALTVLDR
ncbi:MAG: helix-turn-helix domain-containing protein [Ktedonobacteraceae bacterium]|nr:helix-turn-helix domain-containing protein [Ktedonobacteraceae bacterium]